MPTNMSSWGKLTSHMNLKVSRQTSKQIAVLVSVSLAVEVGLGAYFTDIFMRLKDEHRQLMHSFDINNRLRDLSAYTGQRIIAFARAKAMNSPVYYQRAKVCSEKSERALKELTQILEKSENRSPTLAELKRTAREAHETTTAIENAVREGESALADLQSAKLFMKVDRIYELADKLVEENIDQQSRLQKKIDKDQAFLDKAVWLAVAINTLLVVLCSLYFNAGTRKRVAVLCDNASRLAAGLQLNKPLQGDDDLRQIDIAFRTLNQELELLRRKERAILENARDIICSIDEHGTICDINNAATQLWGYERQDMVGKRIAALLDDADKEKLSNWCKRVRESGQGEEFECRIGMKNGSAADCAFSMTWSDEQRLFFAVIHDVTERKAIERLKNDFVSMVSHDLRAPLSAVMMTHELMERGDYGRLNEAGEQALSRARQSIARLMNLVNDLLDLEKMEAGRMELFLEQVDIKGPVENSAEAVRALLNDKQLSLHINLDEPLEAYTDKERLTQVLVNLLTNAIKFSNKGESIEITGRATDGFVILKVIDSGRGIPADRLAAVFERYQQVSAADGKRGVGSGLGLAICKSMIELNGGEIGVESVEGKGTTFWFSLPGNVEQYRRTSS